MAEIIFWKNRQENGMSAERLEDTEQEDYFFLRVYFLAMYCESDMMQYCAWSSFSELGQTHYK